MSLAQVIVNLLLVLAALVGFVVAFCSAALLLVTAIDRWHMWTARREMWRQIDSLRGNPGDGNKENHV